MYVLKLFVLFMHILIELNELLLYHTELFIHTTFFSVETTICVITFTSNSLKCFPFHLIFNLSVSNGNLVYLE